jgi:ribosome-associated protein
MDEIKNGNINENENENADGEINAGGEKYIEIHPEQLAKSRIFAAKLVKILDSKKAGNIKVIEIDKQTIIADFFVIATGTSSTHIKSLAGELEFQLKEENIEPSRISTSNDWVAIDYDSVIVHIFNNEAREYYKLEKLWGDGDNIDVEKLIEAGGIESK